MLVQIGVSLAGSRFTMQSCPSCENRWWESDGELVALDRILATVSAA
jgi:hypothetical protein